MQGILSGLNSAVNFATGAIKNPLLTGGVGVILGVTLSKYLAQSSHQNHSNNGTNVLDQRKIEDLTKHVKEKDDANQQLAIQLQAQQQQIAQQGEQVKRLQQPPTVQDKQVEFTTKITLLPIESMYRIQLERHELLAVVVTQNPQDKVTLTHATEHPDEFQDSCLNGDYLIVNGQRLVSIHRYRFVLVEALPAGRYVCYCLNRDEKSEVITFQARLGGQPKLVNADYHQDQLQELVKAALNDAQSRHQILKTA
jgi:hypothetical protein